MTWFSVDIEADGPCPGIYSMVSFGAVIVESGLDRTFYGRCRPISDRWVREALAVSGHTREECMAFPEAAEEMVRFDAWVRENAGARQSRGQKVPDARFVADNNGFDWMFICYYFHRFVGDNPFGFSSTNLGSLYKGLVRDVGQNFKFLRRTKHSHHPVDDARGNAEALLHMKDKMGLRIGWK